MGHLRQRGRDDGGIQILHKERSRDYVRQPASGRGCWQRTVAHRESQVERRHRLGRRAIVEIDASAAPIDPAFTYGLAQDTRSDTLEPASHYRVTVSFMSSVHAP